MRIWQDLTGKANVARVQEKIPLYIGAKNPN